MGKRSKELTIEDELNIVNMYKNGSRIREIRTIYSCRDSKIKNVLIKYNIKIKETWEYYTSEELATQRKYNVNQNYFENIDCNDKAYWLGFLFADGYVLDRTGENNGKTKGMIVGVALKEDDYEQLYHFRNAIDSNHPIKEKFVKCGDKRIRVYTINIGSVKMAKDLISLGCTPRKSLTLKYPEKLNDKYFFSFLRGYIDGDGCIAAYRENKGQCISLLGTLEFLTEIKNKLESFNIFCGGFLKNKKHLGNTYSIIISRGSFDELFNCLYKNNPCSYMLGRKYEKFQEIGLIRNNVKYYLSETAELFERLF